MRYFASLQLDPTTWSNLRLKLTILAMYRYSWLRHATIDTIHYTDAICTEWFNRVEKGELN